MKLLTILFTIALLITACNQREASVPYWLTDYSEIYKENPNEASKQWFKEAKFGMFVHLNLASLCENGKEDYMLWIDGEASDSLLQFVGCSHEEYENTKDKNQLLFDRYNLEHFDAEKICQLAVAAEMSYITFTTKHLGWCYNFETAESNFNITNAPFGRDMVKELKTACEKYGLALFFYVLPSYIQTRNEEQIRHNRAIINELLTQYGDIAGIWFDATGQHFKNPEFYTQSTETFDLIRQLQPHALISFKEGAFCSEDFITPEHFMLPFEWTFDTEARQGRYDSRMKSWNINYAELWETCNKYKPREICTVMQMYYLRDGDDGSKGGWINNESAEHLTAGGVYYWLIYARYTGSNLLMNIGPRGDGSIHPADWEALTGVGEIIRQKGFPPVVHQVGRP